MSVRAATIKAFLGEADRVVLVRVETAVGSTPRDADTWMLVATEHTLGTIGGGQMEHVAIHAARRLLIDNVMSQRLDIPLGPEIGQCCGGRVELSLQILDGPSAADLTDGAQAAEAAEPHVAIFGCGHVGKALAGALALLPFQTTVYDTRANELIGLSADVRTKVSVLPEAEVRAAPPGSSFIVVTHDHALDFLIMREVLLRGDAAYAGMIGSKSKRAQFKRWFIGEGGDNEQLAELICPIGVAGFADRLGDKRPKIIAALVVAEIVINYGRPRILAQQGNAKPVDAMGDV